MSKSNSSEKRNRGKLFVGNYLLFITVSKAAPQGPKIPAMFVLETFAQIIEFSIQCRLECGKCLMLLWCSSTLRNIFWRQNCFSKFIQAISAFIQEKNRNRNKGYGL